MTQWGVDTLFNPAKRHMDEEKRRLQSTREEVGDNSGGKRIDLTTGKVRIQRTDGGAQTAEPGDPDGNAAAAGEDESQGATVDRAAPGESGGTTGASNTAAERARRRRAAVRRAGQGPAGSTGS